MKVTVDRKNLLSVLNIGGSMSGKSKTLPILDCVKITFKDNSITVSSFDGENAITKRSVDNGIQESGVLCVNYKDLVNILKNIKDELVDLETENLILNISHKKGIFTIPMYPDEDFPSPSREKNIEPIRLKSVDLYNKLKEAKNFVSSDSLKPQLCGVDVCIENGKVEFSASDGSVMFLDEIDNDYEGETLEAVISSRSINSLLSMISDTEDVLVMIGDRNITFRTDDSMLLCRLPVGKFPNCRAIVPKSHVVDIEISKRELTESIDRTIITADEKTFLLKMEASGVSMELSSEDYGMSKKSKEICMCSCSNEITIGVKGTLLKTCLDSIDSDSVILEMNTEKTPIVMKDNNNSHRIILLMPMLLN